MKTLAADGKTEIYQSCNRPLMVKAVDFNQLYGDMVEKNDLLKEMAEAIHYPQCLDTAAYPTLEDALKEVYASFKCRECY